MATHPSSEDFSSTRLVILVADFTGYARLSEAQSDEVMARFLDRFYRLTEDVINAGDGEIVKFMGDSLLAIFPADSAVRAVGATLTLRAQAEQLAAAHGFDMLLGANLHLGSAVIAELGKDPSRGTDVIGRAVNQTFLMGKTAGVRISDALYQELPGAEREAWGRDESSAAYTLRRSDEQ